jgi:hypothetical protein
MRFLWTVLETRSNGVEGHGFRHVVIDVGGAKGVLNWTLSYRQQERAQAASLICLAEAPFGLCRLWIRAIVTRGSVDGNRVEIQYVQLLYSCSIDGI